MKLNTLALFLTVSFALVASCGGGGGGPGDTSTNTNTGVCTASTPGVAANCTFPTGTGTGTATTTATNTGSSTNTASATDTNTATATNTSSVTDTNTATATQTQSSVTTTTTNTATSTVPSWCTQNSQADTRTGNPINQSGKWTATCDGKPDVWTLNIVTYSTTPYATATGSNTTNPAGSATYIGTFGEHCVYLVADVTSTDKTAPTITGSKMTVTLIGSGGTAVVSGGNCTLTWDSTKQ